MYQSKFALSTLSKKQLEKDLLLFLSKNDRIYCRALKRKISLDKLPDAILKRSSSSTSRLKCFFIAIDILKKSKDYTVRTKNGNNEYEILGKEKHDIVVKVHLREEANKKKDKILYFISCY